MAYEQKVDFHAHFLSKTYYEYLDKYEGPTPDSFPTPKWSIEGQLKLMKKLGIAFAFLSVSSPNMSRAERDDEIKYVHEINKEGAEIVRSHPDKFGLFASLPLPHTDAAVEEAKFALDELDACGFGLSTHYAGVYLGDSSYDPLMELLNERGAVIAVHPVKPAALPRGINESIPIPALEFFDDTTRTFTNMVMHNIFGRYPNIKWIFPHAGAFLPILSDRMNSFSIQMRGNLPKDIPFDFKCDMRHVYFDDAGFCLQKQLGALLKDVGAENILYGSDSPYTPELACFALSGGLEKIDCMTEKEKDMMFTGNAVRLFPQLKSILGREDTGGTVCYGERKLTFGEKAMRFLRLTVAKIYSKIFK